MNKKVMILRVLLIIIVIMIIGLSVLYIFKDKIYSTDGTQNDVADNSDNVYDNGIYGKWFAQYNEIFQNGEVIVKDDIANKILKINDSDVDICYSIGYDILCDNYNYSYDNNILVVDDTGLYLSGKNTVEFKDDYMIISKEVEGTEDLVKMYFTRGKDLVYNYSDSSSFWIFMGSNNDNTTLKVFTMKFNKTDVELCNYDSECITVDYSVKNNVLNIKNNNYFSGKYTISYNDLYMILKSNSKDEVYYLRQPSG